MKDMNKLGLSIYHCFFPCIVFLVLLFSCGEGLNSSNEHIKHAINKPNSNNKDLIDTIRNTLVKEFIINTGCCDTNAENLLLPDTFLFVDVNLLKSYKKLHHVDILVSNKLLVDTVIQEITQNNSISSLIIRINDDSVTIPDIMYRLKNLHEIVIICRSFKTVNTCLDFSSFNGLESLILESQNIGDCKIKLPHKILKTLGLESTLIAIPINFYNYLHIDELRLSNNKILSLDPNLIVRNIDSIYLGENPIQQRFIKNDKRLSDEIRAFKKLNPNVNIKLFESLDYK
jgi:hypothetical protein